MLNKLCNSLKGENLVSGFSATGLYPLDGNQVLKHLPECNVDVNTPNDEEVLNESVLTLLKENMGLGVENTMKRKSRGVKCVPGKRITEKAVSDSSKSLPGKVV